MPLDPAVALLLDQLPPLDPSVTVEQMRSLAEAGTAARPADDRGVRSEDRTIPGASDAGIPVRLYTPQEGTAPRGLAVFFHGGGWSICGLGTHDGICRALAAGAGVAVLSVDYRLAPEHRFPAAVDDAWAALQWAHAHAAELGADPERIAVAGDSAGGNLAAVVALLARDHGLDLRLQLLVYPATDFSERRPSFTENGQGYMLTSESIEWFESHYAPDRTDWRASPMLAPDHAGVAPAAVLTCEFDPLRDEGNEYAARLEKAGVDVTLHCYPGLIHGAFSLSDVIPAARAMVDDACAALSTALA